MTMRALNFGQPPGPTAPIAAKVDWCMKALAEIQRWTNEGTAASISQGFTVTNLTESRSFDADAVTAAQLGDVVGTMLRDFSRGGSKRR